MYHRISFVVIYCYSGKNIVIVSYHEFICESHPYSTCKYNTVCLSVIYNLTWHWCKVAAGNLQSDTPRRVMQTQTAVIINPISKTARNSVAETWSALNDLNVNWPCSKCFSFRDIKESPVALQSLSSESATWESACSRTRTQDIHKCVCPAAVVLHLVTRFWMTLLIRRSATDKAAQPEMFHPHTHTNTHTVWLRGYHIVKTGNTLGAWAT